MGMLNFKANEKIPEKMTKSDSDKFHEKHVKHDYYCIRLNGRSSYKSLKTKF